MLVFVRAALDADRGTEIERKMRETAANLEFEKAAALRDELIGT